MRSNVAASGPLIQTHEGTPAPRLTPLKTLRRAVLTALLWEDTFYESGSEIVAGMRALIPQVAPAAVAALAVEARDQMYLRHVPLFLVRELARVPGNGPIVAATLARIIQRPDELSEYLAMYWAKGDRRQDKQPLSAGSKRGLAAAFQKFKPETLAKYDRDAVVKLKDVLRMTRAVPRDTAQAATWRQVIERTLPTPDTWEVQLSAGADKRAVFERLLREDKLGGLAFLRNLRNMIAANVDVDLMRARFTGEFARVLPFRFIAAARHAPRFEPEIQTAMLRACADLPRLAGTTALVVDTSPSMWGEKVSAKSEIDRFEAAAALAMLALELCEHVHIWAFNQKAYEIPARRGFALRDALAATKGGSSCGGLAVAAANARGYDRIIVLTDGQWHVMDGHRYLSEGRAQEVSPPPLTAQAYMVNVAPYQHGYSTGRWESIDGWSERILDFIQAIERESLA